MKIIRFINTIFSRDENNKFHVELNIAFFGNNQMERMLLPFNEAGDLIRNLERQQERYLEEIELLKKASKPKFSLKQFSITNQLDEMKAQLAKDFNSKNTAFDVLVDIGFGGDKQAAYDYLLGEK